MDNVTDIETILTHNEYEALLLENNLIKQWVPQFNINLKDGKSYPVIRITNEDYPRIFRTRRIFFDGSIYFGPFPSAGQLDLYLDLIEKLFPLRKCRGKLKQRQHPCLYYHMKRCSSPCSGKISAEEYSVSVEKIKKLLSGKTTQLIRELTEKMDNASMEQSFEKAAFLRDQIKAIAEFTEGQQVVDNNQESRDYLAYAIEENLYSFVILQMRKGFLIGKELFRVEVYTDSKEVLEQFIVQYYSKMHDPPSKLYMPEGLETDDLSSYISKLIKKDILFYTPSTEKSRKIIAMAEKNAREDVRNRVCEKKVSFNFFLPGKIRFNPFLNAFCFSDIDNFSRLIFHQVNSRFIGKTPDFI